MFVLFLFCRDGRVMGMLEISRSLGDGQYKNHGVTCLPDVRKCQLTENDRLVLLSFAFAVHGAKNSVGQGQVKTIPLKTKIAVLSVLNKIMFSIKISKLI